MFDTSPMFWVMVLMWVIATVAFLSRVDKRKLSILVILLSLLMLISILSERGFVHPSKPAVLPISAPQKTSTF